MVWGAIASAALPVIGQAATSWFGSKKADKQARQAAEAARQAAAIQQQNLGLARGIYQDYLGQAENLVRQYGDKSLDLQTGYYDQGLGYLEPYIGAGDVATGQLAEFMTPEGQADLQAIYEASPSYDMLQAVLDEEERRVRGEYASQGLGRSGAISEELAGRMSGLRLGDYRDWLGRYLSTGTGLAGRGASAAGQAGSLSGTYGANLGRTAMQTGTDLANLRMGAGDYLGRLQAGMGDVAASGVIGASNALTRGSQAGVDYLSKLAGRIGETDLSGIFRQRRPNPAMGWSDPYGYGVG